MRKLGGWLMLIFIGYGFAQNPGAFHQLMSSMGKAAKSHGISEAYVTISSFQQCVISRESGGDSTVWNNQGYPYWGLYQFGKPLWVGNGGNPDDWGKSSTSAAEQTRIFDNVMSHYGGCKNWTPSDGCPDPSNGC